MSQWMLFYFLVFLFKSYSLFILLFFHFLQNSTSCTLYQIYNFAKHYRSRENVGCGRCILMPTAYCPVYVKVTTPLLWHKVTLHFHFPGSKKLDVFYLCSVLKEYVILQYSELFEYNVTTDVCMFYNNRNK